MMRQVRRPTPLDHIPRRFALHHNLIRIAARLGQDEHIKRMIQIPVIDDGIVQWVFRPQRHAASALLVEQQRAHGEGVLVVDWKVGVLLGSAVQLGVPELDVGLVGQETHGIAAWFALCAGPERRVLESVVETGVAEDAEGEGGEDASFLVFPELVGGRDGVVVVGEVVVC